VEIDVLEGLEPRQLVDDIPALAPEVPADEKDLLALVRRLRFRRLPLPGIDIGGNNLRRSSFTPSSRRSASRYHSEVHRK
jgi:hypothetical protein